MSLLYQSTRSSYCGICAVANLLGFYGKILDRVQSRSLFGFPGRGSVPPVTDIMIRLALCDAFDTNALYWDWYRSFSFDQARYCLRPFLDRGPTLLVIKTKHKKRKKNWGGFHGVVAVGVEKDGIHIIDSLGRRNGDTPNATILPTRSNRGWSIDGSPINATWGQFAILGGLPSLVRE